MERSSIVIPHYRTPGHLDLCLRLIDQFTDAPHEVIVVDNGSGRDVLEPLRRREGIVLLEREQDPALDQEAHKAALDLGIASATGRYIVALHSDTFVLRRGWLPFLVERLEDGGRLVFGPSTHRLYPPSLWERIKTALQRNKDTRWIRPVFTIYRAEVFRERRFSDFGDVGELTADYVRSGRAGFLSREEACRWAFHSGGTTKLKILRHRGKARRRKERQFRDFLARPDIQEILGRDPRLPAELSADG